MDARMGYSVGSENDGTAVMVDKPNRRVMLLFMMSCFSMVFNCWLIFNVVGWVGYILPDPFGRILLLLIVAAASIPIVLPILWEFIQRRSIFAMIACIPIVLALLLLAFVAIGTWIQT